MILSFLLRLLGGLAVAAALPAGAVIAAPVRSVPVGANIDWSPARDGSPARFSVGGFALTLTAAPDPESPDFVLPRLRVELPGHAPVEVEGSLGRPEYDQRIAVGRWDADRSYVLYQSFTGGAHCCNEIRLVLPERGRLAVVDLGAWDGGPTLDLPTDRDGDGRVDFVFVDQRFLYAFASYAESFAPPQVLNVIDGERVDVSTRPGFRPLFEEAMADARAACVEPAENGRYPGMAANGACAAFVAAAARLGRFDAAWAEMLRSYDRSHEWPWPTGCRSTRRDGECPEADQIAFDNFPDALRRFLAEQGYIPG